MRLPLVAFSLSVLIGLAAQPAHAGDGDIKKQIADLKDKSPAKRFVAAAALGKLGPKAPSTAVEALVATLGDDDAAVQKAAGSALLAIGDSSVPALAKSLASFNRRSRLMALTVLARFGPDARAAVAPLTEVVGEADVDLQIHAAQVLQAIGPAAKAAVPALVEIAADAGNIGALLRPNLPSSVCEAALEALYVIDPAALQQAAKSGLPKLKKALQSKDVNTRRAAIAGIGLLGHYGSAAASDLAQQFFDVAADAKPEETAIIKSAASAALQQIGPEGHKVLWAIAADERLAFQQRAGIFRSFSWSPEDASKVTIDALRKFLKHKDPNFRRLAAEVLSTLGTAAKAAIPDLVAAFTDETLASEPDYAAAVALARIGEPAIPALIIALSDGDSIVRWQATKTLSFMGRKAKKAIPELRKGLKDQAALVKLESTCALMRAGESTPESTQLLEQQLQFGDAQGRWEVLEIIARVGPRAKQFTPKVLALAEDQDLLKPVLFTLSRLGPAAKAGAPLAAKLLRNDDLGLRNLSLKLLDALGASAKSAVPVLASIVALSSTGLSDEEKEFRLSVLKTIGQIGPDAKEAVPALIAAIKTPDRFELRGLVYALGSIGPDAKEAVPQLVTLLKHKNSHVRQDAVRAIGDIGAAAKDALPAVRELLQDDDRLVCTWAIYAVAQITEDFEPNVQALMTIYKTKVLDPADDSNRFGAILALTRLGPAAKKAVPVLIDAAKETGPELAKQAILALGQFGADAKEAVPFLIELLRHNNADFREAAAQSLGGIGPLAKAAVPRLTEMVNGDEEFVADAAAEALRAIGAKK